METDAEHIARLEEQIAKSHSSDDRRFTWGWQLALVLIPVFFVWIGSAVILYAQYTNVKTAVDQLQSANMIVRISGLETQMAAITNIQTQLTTLTNSINDLKDKEGTLAQRVEDKIAQGH